MSSLELKNYPAVALEGGDNIVGWFRFHAEMMLAYESGKKREPGISQERAEEVPYIYRLGTYVDARHQLLKRSSRGRNANAVARHIRRSNFIGYMKALLYHTQQRAVVRPKPVLVYINPTMPAKAPNLQSDISDSHLRLV